MATPPASAPGRNVAQAASVVRRPPVCRVVAKEYRIRTATDGAWYRCCGGRVRKLVDCCAYSSRRINGDAALTGYCYAGRKVFCVMYFQTKVAC